MTHKAPSAWISEDVWRRALDGARERIQAYESQTYFNRQGKLDANYTAKLHADAQRRFELIFAAGQQDWQQ
jgi:hypothetical protein